MTVIIDGTNGVQSVDGSAGTASLTNDGDTNTGIFFPAADTLAVTTAGSERLRIDSSGNLGLGTSSPAVKLAVVSTGGETFSISGGGTSTQYQRFNTTGGNYYIGVSSSTGTGLLGGASNYSMCLVTESARDMIFGTNNTERLRIDSSGNLGLGIAPSTSWRTDATLAAFEVKSAGSAIWNAGARNFNFSNNSYWVTGGTFQYASTGAASWYQQTNAEHRWYNAASGTAGNTITFTQAMTLTSGGDLGIGTTSPASGYRLDVVNSKGQIRIGSSSSSAANVPVLAFNHSGNDEFQIRAGSGLSFWQSGATEVMRIAFGGEVYIAGFTDQGAYNLQVAGTGVWGAGAYVNGSDARLKDNIESLDSCLDVVNALRPVTFQYKPEHSKDQSVQTGFIAQELQQALAGKPYLDGLVKEGPEHLNVAYQNIIPLLTKAIQEQQAMIKALEAKVAAAGL
jgi:hypothetical protein